jgi:hypothetical protein
MKRGQFGYTIVEVMLFLGISGSLLAIAFTGFSSRRATTEFNQAMNDIEFKIKQTFEDAQNGLYQNLANISCDLSGVGPLGGGGYPRVSINATGAEAGSGRECIYLGRVLVFGGEADRNIFRTYSIIGKRDLTLKQTKDVLPTVADINILGERGNLNWGVRVLSRPNAPAGKAVANVVGAVNGLDDTRQKPALFTLPGYLANVDAVTSMNVAASYNGLTGHYALGKSRVNFVPKIICFERSNGAQIAQIEVGATGQGLTTQLTMDRCEATP